MENEIKRLYVSDCGLCFGGFGLGNAPDGSNCFDIGDKVTDGRTISDIVDYEDSYILQMSGNGYVEIPKSRCVFTTYKTCLE
ncbi:hypothetical protein [Convivina intestini]|uniref:hypothetical protein n=1 Tax=Convivina intestini TaxID=1505726 RepID=UPI00200F4FD9|nr:hypothetical protein [Convivina intestini]CAH1853825.1 hypothetical protein R078131_00844 [Convivina intestini]